MIKFSTLVFLTTFLSLKVWCQEAEVIELEQVEVIPTDELLVYSNFTKRHRENSAKVLGPNGKMKEATVIGLEINYKAGWT
ncbi:MAG: hypothetical protein ABJ333_01610 [Algoriphagus sp.]|uniref:hypothetical protein n=1 Tax=Algoriphagus sp. TaxID=1872435 RepID=UPI00327B2036